MTRLIDADALKEETTQFGDLYGFNPVWQIIDNAPTIEPFEKIGAICDENCGYRPQGEYVDISKLRLMTVEECAGHTIDYAMGWKACVEWIKKGGAEK